MTRARGAATALLVLGLAAAIEAHRLKIGDPGHPGPGFFPFWLGIALAIVAIILLVQRVPLDRTADGPPAAAARVRVDKVVLTLGAGLAYALAVESLGFTATTFVFLMFLLTVIQPVRLHTSVVISAATAAVSYVVFKIWLAVQLPVGPWGF